MLNKINFYIVIFCFMSFSNVLDIYDSYRFDETDSVMSSVYTGPIFTTGGADKGHFIKTMEPTKIGAMEEKRIVLIGDSTNEVYQFDSVSFFEVSKNNDTFYVMKILAQYKQVNYDIIIELRHGQNFDRVMTIYKEGKPDLMILWIETSRLKQKPDRKI